MLVNALVQHIDYVAWLRSVADRLYAVHLDRYAGADKLTLSKLEDMAELQVFRAWWDGRPADEFARALDDAFRPAFDSMFQILEAELVEEA